MPGARVEGKASASAFTRQTLTGDRGEFILSAEASRLGGGNPVTRGIPPRASAPGVFQPRRGWFNTNVNFGSGFLDGDGPQQLQYHTSADVAIGKSIGELLSVTVSGLNISNSRFLFGSHSSFAGTHYNEPREIIGSIRYRFRF
jgi:hypothetical protein